MNRHRTIFGIWMSFYTVALMGCSQLSNVGFTDGGVSPDGGLPVSYALNIQPIWNRHCISCHSWVSGSGAVGQQRPRLDEHESHHALVSVPAVLCFGNDATGNEAVPLVDPMKPEHSGLLGALGMTSLDVLCQVTMPKNTQGLSLKMIAPEEFKLVYQWILDGAKDN